MRYKIYVVITNKIKLS